MSLTDTHLTGYLLSVLRGVLEDSGVDDPGPLDAEVRFSDVADSMAMVEFLGIVAEDCGCELSAIEEAVDQRFGTIGDLARGLQAANLSPQEMSTVAGELSPRAFGSVDASVGERAARHLKDLELKRTDAARVHTTYLAGSAVRLPRTVQHAQELDAAVGRPIGWLERRAGILQRCVWDMEDAIEVAAGCAADALHHAHLPREKLQALLVVSEAPPLAVGLAAAIHDRIGLNSTTACYELGGACTGFLSALALGRSLVRLGGSVLIVSVEAHSRLLPLEVGPYGESAALFGDGCAAVVLSSEPGPGRPISLVDLSTFADGAAGDLICVRPRGTGTFGLEMDGVPLTEFALHALSAATRDIAAKHAIPLSKISAIVAHGGNGRMPAMLARLLHVPVSKVWSEVIRTGNLGSASVPAAWAAHSTRPNGPVIWTAVGAGLVWGAALWDVREQTE